MKSSILFLFLAVVLTGCSTLSRDQISAYNNPSVPGPVYARIQGHQKLAVSDVVDLSRSGVRSSEIITYLSETHGEFNLTQQDVENLQQEGVSGDVITYMLEKPDDKGGLFSMF